jgi:NAD(P)-dependent dehydrogenase (short-subunit alcohol dehydrogenase family)
MQTFANRIVLITGAGSGLGREFCRALAGECAAIAAIDRNPDSLAALAAELSGKRLATAVADVTDLAGMRSAITDLERRLGPTDVLFANAGIGRETSALNFNAADVAAQINVNLIGVANSIDAVLPGMRERRRGHLVVLSSLASYRGLPMMAGYCASKSGVSALAEALRCELEPIGVDVTIVCPGWIRTPLTSNIDVPQPHMMEVGPAVARILKAVRKRRAFLAFPAWAAWQVRLMRWLPSRLSDWLVRRRLAALQKSEVRTSL